MLTVSAATEASTKRLLFVAPLLLIVALLYAQNSPEIVVVLPEASVLFSKKAFCWSAQTHLWMEQHSTHHPELSRLHAQACSCLDSKREPSTPVS